MTNTIAIDISKHVAKIVFDDPSSGNSIVGHDEKLSEIGIGSIKLMIFAFHHPQRRFCQLDLGLPCLKAANVNSTFEILKTMRRAGPPIRLVYVTSGRSFDESDKVESVLKKLSDLDGYRQTKFLSQALVKTFANREAKIGGSPHIATIELGLIVGPMQEVLQVPVILSGDMSQARQALAHIQYQTETIGSTYPVWTELHMQ